VSQYKGGTMQALAHIFARIDVVLAPYEKHPGGNAELIQPAYPKPAQSVQPFVNEVYPVE
jgi:hypothetical protein